MTRIRNGVWVMGAGFLCASWLGAQNAPDCDQWNTEEFFASATVEDVNACLAAGSDVAAPADSVGVRGYTPLHHAAEFSDNPLVIEALLAAGADLTADTNSYRQPVELAARNENLAVLQALLAAGADVMIQDPVDVTLLHIAAEYNTNPDVIQYLLDAGLQVDARDRYLDKTPLHAAASYNENPQVIEVLLAAGADVNARDESGETPLAATFLRYALRSTLARSASAAVIEVLLSAGADPTISSPFGWTPLQRAAGREGPALIETLLNAGADATALDEDGRSALHYAASGNESVAVYRMLVAAGADPTIRSAQGSTVLHSAAFNPNVAVVEAVLADGAPVGARDEDGGTALYNAGGSSNPDVIEALLAAGADPTVRTAAGTTVLHRAASNPNAAAIEVLLAHGVALEARDDDGRTPLYNAARNSNLEVIEALLAAGADPDVRDGNGSTPLHWAVAILFPIPNPEVIAALLAAGIDPDVQDEDGDTPLHDAAGASLTYTELHAGEAIEVLLDAGADATIRNAADRTPWDVAQENEALRGSDAYWRLNDARFDAPVPDARAAPAGGQFPAAAEPRRAVQLPAAVESAETVAGVASNGDASATGGRCDIPDYPTPPGGVANLGLSWCPASVSIQRRAFALQAAGAWCAIDGGSSTTAEQLQARHEEINAACDALDAMQSPGIATCQCPAGYRQ